MAKLITRRTRRSKQHEREVGTFTSHIPGANYITLWTRDIDAATDGTTRLQLTVAEAERIERQLKEHLANIRTAAITSPITEESRQ